jgi:hypothetical protein
MTGLNTSQIQEKTASAKVTIANEADFTDRLIIQDADFNNLLRGGGNVNKGRVLSRVGQSPSDDIESYSDTDLVRTGRQAIDVLASNRRYEISTDRAYTGTKSMFMICTTVGGSPYTPSNIGIFNGETTPYGAVIKMSIRFYAVSYCHASAEYWSPAGLHYQNARTYHTMVRASAPDMRSVNTASGLTWYDGTAWTTMSLGSLTLNEWNLLEMWYLNTFDNLPQFVCKYTDSGGTSRFPSSGWQTMRSDIYNTGDVFIPMGFRRDCSWSNSQVYYDDLKLELLDPNTTP